MLSEPPFRNRKLKLKFTGIPGEPFRKVRLRSIANSRRREQGSDTSGTRRNKKRATIHEFIRAGKKEIRMLSRQTQFKSGCVIRFGVIVFWQFYAKSVCPLFPINTCAGSQEFDAGNLARADRCRQSQRTY